MEHKSRRRGDSLVLPILLILLGVLLLLDNLNIIAGIDWSTIWRLWPVLLIALGLEIILGRRVSFGTLVLLLVAVVVVGGIVWWSVIMSTGERTAKTFTWERGSTERAELEVNVGVGELKAEGSEDMADLLSADLDLAPGIRAEERLDTVSDIARGRISSSGQFFGLPYFLGGKPSQWNLKLNDRVRWDLNVNTGVGETALDLAELRVGDMTVDAGIGSVRITMPRRGGTEATIKVGIGEVEITFPEGVQARVRVEHGIGDLTIGSRFVRRGDYLETEGFDQAESYIDLRIDVGIGSVTVR